MVTDFQAIWLIVAINVLVFKMLRYSTVLLSYGSGFSFLL